MPSITVIKALTRELVTTKKSWRTCEPDLVMDDPEKVAAYVRAGRVDAVMAPVYIFHCAQICEVIHPGDTVIDLGCGPANQLALVARLNPACQFIGLDLSDEMLQQAGLLLEELELDNVELRKADITNLDNLETDSVDAVMSTMVLHHLPDETSLERCFSEISRVLKPGGGLYLVDFGHLKSEKTIEDFAYQYAHRQPELFTLDYLYSLQAAFEREDFEQLYRTHLAAFGQFHTTFLVPYMMAIKSPARRKPDEILKREFRNLVSTLPSWHKTDLKDLRNFFALGGMRSYYL